MKSAFFYLYLLIFSLNSSFSQSLDIQKTCGVTYIGKTMNFAVNQIFPVSSLTKVQPGAEQELDNSALWQLKFTAAGKVFKDISFANTFTGYIVTELGAVYKTTNDGDNWVSILNLGFPYYWYGVYALSPDTVIISGFNNQGNIHSGVLRWSFNGGNTWSQDISISIPNGVGWLTKVHFFNANTGFVMAEFSGGVHYTTNGGKDSASWHYVQVNSDLAWFAGNIDAQPSGICYATGIHFAKSTDYGLDWTSGPSADFTFDGGVDFLDYNNLKGLTGGGQISPSSEGWCHWTTDGGITWSSRISFPYPIRTVKFLNDTLGFAAGGNLYQEAGGIYTTVNGGLNWSPDINTSAEMFAFETKQISADSSEIWCIGSTGGGTGYTGKAYKCRVGVLTGINNASTQIPNGFILYQNYPNPFNPVTKIKFDIPSNVKGETSNVEMNIYDVTGKETIVLINRQLNPGVYEVEWNASDYPSGIYFYKLTAGNSSVVKKMILIK